MKTARTFLPRPLFLLPFFLLVASSVDASGWTVDKDRSAVTYLSTKMSGANTILENNRFTNFSGKIGNDGEVSLLIDLNSVATGVPIRDERVKQYVFDIRNHPQATVKLSVGEFKAADRRSGRTQTVEASLTMRGVTHRVRGEVSVAWAGDDLLVQTQSPVLVDASSYGMLEGFEALRNIMQLSNIPTTIPVSLKLVFVAGQ